MKYLITGGAGFLGSHLVEKLLQKGNYVICVDNFLTGAKSNVDEYLSNPNFELIEHDVKEPIPYTKPIDVIFNLACPASPIQYQINPIDTLLTSVLGAKNSLELAKENNAIIVHASTSEVYGDPLVHPQPETYRGNVNPNGVRACYDEGKRCAEALCLDYSRMFNVRVKIARLFNTYGPRCLLMTVEW